MTTKLVITLSIAQVTQRAGEEDMEGNESTLKLSWIGSFQLSDSEEQFEVCKSWCMDECDISWYYVYHTRKRKEKIIS